MFYTDIHAHIIPGVDDGPQNIEESIEMLSTAYAEGIRRIIATPHFGLKNPDLKQEEAKLRLNALRKIISCDMPDLKLDYGNEIYWSKGTIESLNAGLASTMAGSDYVLIEFNVDEPFEQIEDAIINLNWNGYKPILAHTERYEELNGRADRIRQLKERGMMVQVNCRSLMEEVKAKKGFKSLFARKNGRCEWGEQLLRENLIDFIASDCHNNEIRCPVYKDAAQHIISVCGEKEALRILNKSATVIA